MYQYSFSFTPHVTAKRTVSAPPVEAPWNEVTDLHPEPVEQLQFEFSYQSTAEKQNHS